MVVIAEPSSVVGFAVVVVAVVVVVLGGSGGVVVGCGAAAVGLLGLDHRAARGGGQRKRQRDRGHRGPAQARDGGRLRRPAERTRGLGAEQVAITRRAQLHRLEW
jgi:hypothetical protein